MDLYQNIKDQNKIMNFLRKHQSQVRWFFLFIDLIFILLTVRTYINYWNIQQTIIMEKKETQKIRENIAYLDNFKKKYLISEYAPYFLAHENNKIFDKEYVVVLPEKNQVVSKVLTKTWSLLENQKYSNLLKWKKLIKKRFWYIFQ